MAAEDATMSHEYRDNIIRTAKSNAVVSSLFGLVIYVAALGLLASAARGVSCLLSKTMPIVDASSNPFSNLAGMI
jgi:hypothetical protein